jgi:MscS family membrane protein
MSLLAGLGLGGLALALAAQDTAANVFGSVAIMFDNPFKVGDWIKLKDAEGTVEEIGFRSTRIRTFYNSVVTLPNAMIAKEVVDNMGIRPARRIRQIIGITYETPIPMITQFCDEVRYMITNHPQVNADSVTVNFNNFNASSLDILVNFHIRVFTGPEEMELQQKIFIQILEIASRLKVDFAYPTQTTYSKNLDIPTSTKDFVPTATL